MEYGTYADWAMLCVSSVALYFSWIGYKSLIKGQKDTRDQIEALRDSAISTAKIAEAQHKLNEARRHQLTPILKIRKCRYNDGHDPVSILFDIENLGLSILRVTEFELYHGESLTIGNTDLPQISPGQSITLSVDRTIPKLKKFDCIVIIRGLDTYGELMQFSLEFFNGNPTISQSQMTPHQYSA